MIDYEIKKKILASKKLNKLCRRIDNDVFKAEVFWCRAAYDGYERWNYKMHRHSFFEMHFGLGGKIIYDFTDEAAELTAGKYIVIPPGTPHRIVCVDEGSSVFKLAFKIENQRIAEHMKSRVQLFYVSNADSYINSSIEFMLEQATGEKHGFAEAINNQLSAFAIYILQSVPGVFDFLQSDSVHDIDMDDRVRVVKQIIKDNLAETLKSDDIARQVNISIRHLNRIIKHSDNMSLAELIRKMRLDEAKRLLAHTDYSLDVIAEKTGFSCSTHFGRMFKALEGCTPGQYRKDINT